MKQLIQIAALLLTFALALACGKKAEHKPGLIKHGLAAAIETTSDKPNYENKAPVIKDDPDEIAAQPAAGAAGKSGSNGTSGQAGKTDPRK